MFAASLIVQPPDKLVLVVVLSNAIPELSTRIVGNRNEPQKIHRRFAELRWIDPVVDEGSTQHDLPAAVTQRRSYCSEISSAHCRSRGKRQGIGGFGSHECSLVSPEVKEFIFQDRSADHSTELVPLQAIGRKSERLARVEDIVSNEFE